jgi:hypothetical protein
MVFRAHHDRHSPFNEEDGNSAYEYILVFWEHYSSFIIIKSYDSYLSACEVEAPPTDGCRQFTELLIS